MRPPCFDAGELTALRAAAERLATRVREWSAPPCGHAYEIDGLPFRDVGPVTVQYEPLARDGAIRVVEPAHHLDRKLGDLVDDARLSEPARALIPGSELALFTDKFNFKPARCGSGFRWHQDAPYWAHLPDAAHHVGERVNAMIALDDADAGNGCFRVIAGSHRRGALPGCREDGVLAPLFTDPKAIDFADERPLPLRAGSLVFFHSHLVHGSAANRSDRPRRALVVTYQRGGLAMFKLPGVRPIPRRTRSETLRRATPRQAVQTTRRTPR